MKLLVTIEVDASETIIDTIKRGNFSVDKDGSGHKLVISDDIVVPSRKCLVKYSTQKDEKKDESAEVCDTCCP